MERVGVSDQYPWAENGNHTYVDFLVRDAAIVLRTRTRACQGTLARTSSPSGSSYLQDVVVLDALSDGNLFQSLEDLSEVLVRDVVQLGAVVYAVRSPEIRSLFFPSFFSGSGSDCGRNETHTSE